MADLLGLSHLTLELNKHQGLTWRIPSRTLPKTFVALSQRIHFLQIPNTRHKFSGPEAILRYWQLQYHLASSTHMLKNRSRTEIFLVAHISAEFKCVLNITRIQLYRSLRAILLVELCSHCFTVQKQVMKHYYVTEQIFWFETSLLLVRIWQHFPRLLIHLN